MESKSRPTNTRFARLTRWVATPLVVALMPPMLAWAQTLPPVPPPVLASCSVPPSPESDAWPVANTDNIGATTGAPLLFNSAQLLANDTGVGTLTVTSPIDTTPHKGGTVTGANPFTYTPPASFTGTDSFTYEVSDSLGRKTTGIVKVSVAVAPDGIAPQVTITAPLGGTVSNTVAVSANAFDAVGVAGVRFFLDDAPLGVEDTAAPYQVSWNTTLGTDGAHALKATARDAAGNVGTSTTISVNVSNVVTPPPPPPPPSGIAVQSTVSVNGQGPITTPAFSTAVPGQVLVALAASDGPTSGANNQFLTISGGGLAWTRVQRAAVQRGVAEIWTATASSVMTGVTVTSTQSVGQVLGSSVNQSLVVVAFTGATGVGASKIANGATGAPTISLVTQAAGSLIFGAGIDFDRAVARTVPTGQTKIHEYLAPSGDTMWMQRLDAATGAAGSTARLNDTAPTTDQWNYAAVEIMSGAPPASVAVPSVVGQLRADAEAAIVGASLTVGAVTEANHPTMGIGRVISQTPGFPNSALVGSSVSLVVSLGPAPVTPPPAGGLVLALNFNELSGATALDASGNNLNGTVLGATRVEGRFGGALSFDGVNDWVTVTDTTGSPLDLTAGMTLEAWVKPDALNGWDTALLKERGANLMSYGLYAHDGAPLAGGVAAPAGYIRTGSADQAIRNTAPLAVGEWSHLAMTYDGATMRIYVNGVQVASRAQSGAIAVGNGALRIGGNNSFAGEFFRGLIDEVRVYNRALSAAEITQDMNSGIQ